MLAQHITLLQHYYIAIWRQRSLTKFRDQYVWGKLHECVYLYSCMYIQICIQLPACLPSEIHICLHVLIHAYIHMYKWTHMYSCIHTCIHTYIQNVILGNMSLKQIIHEWSWMWKKKYGCQSENTCDCHLTHNRY